MKNNWPTKKVKDCLEKIPRLGSVFSSKTLKEGKFPIIDQGQDFIAGYTNDKSLVFSDCLPVVIFGDHTRILKFIDFPFAVGADGTKILKPNKDFDSRFFYYMLLSLDLESRGYARHFKLLRESEIPLPPLSEQKKIVKILDEKMRKIAEAKKLREEALADTERIFPQTLHEISEEGKKKEWEEKMFEEVLDYEQPTRYIVSSKDYSYDYKTPVLTAGKTFILGHTKEKDGIFPTSKLPVIIFDDFTTAIKFVDFPFKVKSSAMKILHTKKGKANARFLFYLMQIIKINHYTHKRYWISEYSKVRILLPSLAEQQKIVSRLGALSAKIRQATELQKSQLEDFKKLEKAYLREAFSEKL